MAEGATQETTQEAMRVFFNHTGPQIFRDCDAKEFYTLGMIDRSLRDCMREFGKTHITFARDCMAAHPTDPRWKGLTEYVMKRLNERTNRHFGLEEINLRGCVSPASFPLLKDMLWRFSDAKVLIGALPHDHKLLFGLSRLPVSTDVECKHYTFRPAELKDPSEEEDSEEEESQQAVFEYSNCFAVGKNVHLGGDLAVDFANGCAEVFIDCKLRCTSGAEVTKYAEMTYDPPFAPRHFPSVKTLVIEDVLPDDFNFTARAVAGVRFLDDMLKCNPQISTVSIVQADFSCMIALTMEPRTGAEENSRGGAVLCGCGGCRFMHRNLRDLWDSMLMWKRAEQGCTLKVLFTYFRQSHMKPADNRSECFTYGTDAWPLDHLLP